MRKEVDPLIWDHILILLRGTLTYPPWARSICCSKPGDAKRYEQRGVSADKGDVHAALISDLGFLRCRGLGV